MRRGTSAMLAVLLLGGCGGALLGGGRPAQLYRLDGLADTAAAPLAASAGPVVLLLPVRFAPGIDSDRMLAVEGQRALYLKGARWLAELPQLFEEALRARLARESGLLLSSEREPAGAGLILQLSVDHFEAVYSGPAMDMPPTVQVEGEARLYRARDRQLVTVRRFAAQAPARDNRLGAIAEAFAEATRGYAAQLGAWLVDAPPDPATLPKR